MTKNNIYRPTEIANMYGIHSNTVRLYEKLGFISEARRSNNGYREYTDIHVSQLKICRYIFGYSFSNRRIRKCGRDILFASASQDWNLTLEKTLIYINVIEQELALADEAVQIMKDWLFQISSRHDASSDTTLFSRKDLSDMLHVTLETIRNWDRNGVICSIQKDENGRILYDALNRDKAKMVYLLLQCGYSMSAIYKAIFWGTKGQVDKAIYELETPDYDELLSAGDSWRKELKKILEGAKQIPPIVEQLKNI